MKILVCLIALSAIFLCTEGIDYQHHVTLKAGVFDVYWTVNTSDFLLPFYFKYKAKTTGWAALGFTAKPGGKDMLEYDIALGGVRNGNDTYLNDYWSLAEGKPELDFNPLQSLTLISATEANGYTTIEFKRRANTLDTTSDQKLVNGTAIYLAWAIATADATNKTTYRKHDDSGHTTVAYNMFTGEQIEVSLPTSQGSTTTQPSGMSTTVPACGADNIPAFLVLVLVQLTAIFSLL